MYLEKLNEKLGITNEFDKTIVAVMVYRTIKANNSITLEADAEIKEKLLEGLDSYKFAVISLADYWDNDLQDLLLGHLNIECEQYRLYENIIWPYLRENEVYPGLEF